MSIRAGRIIASVTTNAIKQWKKTLNILTKKCHGGIAGFSAFVGIAPLRIIKAKLPRQAAVVCFSLTAEAYKSNIIPISLHTAILIITFIAGKSTPNTCHNSTQELYCNTIRCLARINMFKRLLSAFNTLQPIRD